ncbi:unnamed protein product, partial [Didymodactylos carnosus]
MHNNSTIVLLTNSADKDDGGNIAIDNIDGFTSGFEGTADDEDEDPEQNELFMTLFLQTASKFYGG